MNIEEFREYCLSLPQVTEDEGFGPGLLLFRVCNKIFACMGLEKGDAVIMKCDPDLAVGLRERYEEIVPAPSWNKKHWNKVSLTGRLTDESILALTRHAYAMVVKKLTQRERREHPEICISDPFPPGSDPII